LILDKTLELWKSSRRVKTSSSGWISANAPCCIHNGENADTRGRGGLIQNDQSISYHCFNCGFKSSYVPGRPLSYKFRKLLSWLGADENTLRHLVIESIRIKEQLSILEPTKLPEPISISYRPRPLPQQAQDFNTLLSFYQNLENKASNMSDQMANAMEYVIARDIDIKKYDFYWTPQVEHKLNYRVIVPFKWQDQIIGYTARSIVDGINPKYHSEYEPNYVFNVDQQKSENKFVLVSEGVFDAMSIDGLAVLSNECNETQADIIDSLGKEVILVPDFDLHINKQGKKVWPGSRLIDQAVEYGWSVSFPIWSDTCKDVNDAVVRYGKLFTLKSILDSREHNKIKIELLKRKIING
jgi:hypothetical protein